MDMELKEIRRNKNNGKGIKRYINSFFHAVDGLKYAIIYEQNIIVIIVCAILAIFAGFIFKINMLEWCISIIMIALVMAIELINTAIEATIDLVTIDIHPLAKIAKDTAACATLTFSVASFVVALLIYIPKIIELF